jgi:hypothetical protein
VPRVRLHLISSVANSTIGIRRAQEAPTYTLHCPTDVASSYLFQTQCLPERESRTRRKRSLFPFPRKMTVRKRKSKFCFQPQGQARTSAALGCAPVINRTSATHIMAHSEPIATNRHLFRVFQVPIPANQVVAAHAALCTLHLHMDWAPC